MEKPDWLPRAIHGEVPVDAVEKRAVMVAQRALMLPPTGRLDLATRAALRGLQRLCGIPVHGSLDELTASAVEALWPFSWHEVDGHE